MEIIGILIVQALWLCSLFSFAKRRLALIGVRKTNGNVLNDIVFQIYMRVSGFILILWIGVILWYR